MKRVLGGRSEWDSRHNLLFVWRWQCHLAFPAKTTQKWFHLVYIGPQFGTMHKVILRSFVEIVWRPLRTRAYISYVVFTTLCKR